MLLLISTIAAFLFTLSFVVYRDKITIKDIVTHYVILFVLCLCVFSFYFRRLT